MKPRNAPRLDTRRASELEAELSSRARAWLPEWSLDEESRDFGRALLKVAARFGSEVTERLDRAGDRLRLAFLDWLAVPAQAARPARLPVVFKLAGSARSPVLADAGTRMQVEAAGLSVILETERPVFLVPGALETLVGVDAGKDAFYLPPPGLTTLESAVPQPAQWLLKSFASAGAMRLQLDPEVGLAKDVLIEGGGSQYRLAEEPDQDIVTLDRPLEDDLPPGSVVKRVAAFAPFDTGVHNQQLHALYLGHETLFDIEAQAVIEILGANTLSEGVQWEYWGKNPVSGSDAIAWWPLEPGDEAAQQISDGIVLMKPRGAIEALEVAKDRKSRWIRAVTTNVSGTGSLLTSDKIEVLVNCSHDGQLAIPPPPDGEPEGPTAEGMASTTPLVLNNVFFPFGKEPRQFDAFYLGSQEVFSKHGADVTLDFEMADTTFAALSAARSGSFAETLLAGVGQDRALHLLSINSLSGVIGKFRDREPLRPPGPGAGVGGNVQLDRRPVGRLPLWVEGEDIRVAVSAGDAVWVWQEDFDTPDESKWQSLDTIPASTANSDALIDDLVYLKDIATLFAVRDGRMYSRAWPGGARWDPVDTVNGTGPVKLTTLAPVLDRTSGTWSTSSTAGMIGVGDNQRLYTVTHTGACTKLSPTDVNRTVRPLAARDGAGATVVALVHSQRNELAVFHSVHGKKEFDLPETDAKITGFEVVMAGTKLLFLAGVSQTTGGSLASWTPHTSTTTDIRVFRADIPLGVGIPGGSPVVAGTRVIVPGASGDLLLAPLDIAGRKEFKAVVGQGLVVPASAPNLATNDIVTLDEAGAPPFVERLIRAPATSSSGEDFYPLDQPFDDGAVGAIAVFRSASSTHSGDTDHSASSIELDGGDNDTFVNALLRIDGTIHRVTDITASGGVRTATLDPAPATASGVAYQVATVMSGRLAPFIKLNASNNDWDAKVLPAAKLVFPGAEPESQSARVFLKDIGDHPLLVVLGTAWTTSPTPSPPPAGASVFIVDAVTGTWTRSLGDNASTNPELSWEYWNGTGWWKLVLKNDTTLNLKKSGKIRFEVPPDLAATDWSGRINFWIRSRLVGGDYGREEVSVVQSPPDKDGKARQTVERSTANIHAPSVVSLKLSWEVCTPSLPDLVLAQDAGSLRDQSDANRTAGARVEAFVPLGLLLGRLAGSVATAPTAQECPPECACGSAAPAAAASAAPDTLPIVAAADTGRAVYLGFDAPLSGEPVNVLLLLEERPHDGFAPLVVEALIADRFVPLVIEDTTRALGESGVLSLAFAVAPTPRELFGKSLTWLRLSPRGATQADWLPRIRGAYLNATWAVATETLTFELVGSSQGEPDLTLFLAKPPVLLGSLELRVREPLGEEERAQLLAEGAGEVVSNIENLPGDWVLWRRVIDPGDEAPTARVFALDDGTGEIRFGDGRHGRIPPVGRDSIVAFRYRRTQPGNPGGPEVPANTVAAGSQINLVSPVAGVEAAFAADQAAGGSPADSAARVLRHGIPRLRHRERALTACDVEDMVLGSSPDFAQAHCFQRDTFVRLVVVMRGANPLPSAAQVRELHLLLVTQGSPSLGAPDALRISGPALLRLRVVLKLRVASLEVAGGVVRTARDRIADFFDTATGGADANGWQLGWNPAEGDIALALSEVPDLEGIAGIELREVTLDGGERPWPANVGERSLVALDDDAVRVTFEPLEVLA